jgi:hypothetical protein
MVEAWLHPLWDTTSMHRHVINARAASSKRDCVTYASEVIYAATSPTCVSERARCHCGRHLCHLCGKRHLRADPSLRAKRSNPERFHLAQSNLRRPAGLLRRCAPRNDESHPSSKENSGVIVPSAMSLRTSSMPSMGETTSMRHAPSHDGSLLPRQGRQHALRQIQMRRDKLRWSERHPLGERDVPEARRIE